MLSKHKLVQFLNDVLLIFRVLLIKHLDQLCLNQTLLIESFLVLQHFQSNELLKFMVESPNHNTETTLTQFLNYFITVIQVVVISNRIFLLVCIESVISRFVDPAPRSTTCLL